ncbi:MAG: RHS repeat-associated core domain-containing protein [Phycisphaerae bacterium]
MVLPNTDQRRKYTLDGLRNWRATGFMPVGSTAQVDQRNNNHVNQITRRSVATAITLPNTDQSRNCTLDGLGNWRATGFMPVGAVTGLYDDRFRNYSPTLGRWTSQDPLGYINGANTYQFVDSSPVGNVDAEGTVIETNHAVLWALESTLPPGTVIDSATVVSTSPFIPTGPGKTTESGWIYRSYKTTTPGEVVDTIRAIVTEPGSKCKEVVRLRQFTAATRTVVTNDSFAINLIAGGIAIVGVAVGTITSLTGAGVVPGLIIGGAAAVVSTTLVAGESYPPTGVSISYYGSVVNPDQIISAGPEE